MTLQERILKAVDGKALAPKLFYWLLRDASHEAVDAALKALREAGLIVFAGGRFQKPATPRAYVEKVLPNPNGRRASEPVRGQSLTSREITVAIVAGEGGTAQEISAALGMSRHTLKGHLSRIYAKLGVEGKSELARALAAREGA